MNSKLLGAGRDETNQPADHQGVHLLLQAPEDAHKVDVRLPGNGCAGDQSDLVDVGGRGRVQEGRPRRQDGHEDLLAQAEHPTRRDRHRDPLALARQERAQEAEHGAHHRRARQGHRGQLCARQHSGRARVRVGVAAALLLGARRRRADDPPVHRRIRLRL